MRYTVVLEQEPDGGYVVSVPTLPGCVSQGDNRQDALRNIREAIALAIHLVVHIARVNGCRRVTEVMTIRGYDGQSDRFALEPRSTDAILVGATV